VFSGMIRCLNETFPDARFVCMVRSPHEVIPSVLSLYQSYSSVFFTPRNIAELNEAAQRVVTVYYRYPLEQLALLPPERQMIITYPTLMQQLQDTVQELYQRFGLDLSHEYEKILQQEDARAKRYTSTHHYSLEQFGLTPEEVLSQFSDIFERFGFKQQ
jgi:hypothetical protein